MDPTSQPSSPQPPSAAPADHHRRRGFFTDDLAGRVLERLLWAWAGAMTIGVWRAEVRGFEFEVMMQRLVQIETTTKVDHELLRRVAAKVGVDPDAVARSLATTASRPTGG